MSLTPLAFTGISEFSQDFQTILNRAVTIASQPIVRLQQDQANLLSRTQAVESLRGKVTSLADRLRNLGETAERKALTAESTNTAKVSVTAAGATSAATYRITEITSLAEAATEVSVNGYPEGDHPVSATGIFKLVIGTKEHTINLAGNNTLAGLRDALNNLNAGVRATVLTTGTGANPNYLSVTATAAGATTLQLIDDPDGAATQVLTAANQGSDTVFKVNGVEVRKTGTLINDVVPGMTFSILATTAAEETITLSLTSERGTLKTALKDFVSAYNATVSEVDTQVGPAAGMLSGDYLVREAQHNLRKLTSYLGDGAITSLTDLGIELTQSGEMLFNTAVFDSLSDSRFLAAFDFLGSTSTGFGKLVEGLNAISDPVTGLAKLQLDQYKKTDKSITDQIATLTEKVGSLQQTMFQRLQAADALLARLDSQRTVLDASVKSLSLVMYGKSKDS